MNRKQVERFDNFLEGFYFKVEVELRRHLCLFLDTCTNQFRLNHGLCLFARVSEV